MKIPIIGTAGEKGKKELPIQFNEPVNPDLIQRAVLAEQSKNRQRYGALQDAGERQSAKISRRRRDYKTSYGIGISRTPRKIISRRGTRFNWVGAFAPNTVGGRKAKPPKSTKIWVKKINRKENNKAIRSAISATISKEIVTKHGHMTPDNYPFAIEAKFEDMKKTKEAITAFEKLGLGKDLARAEVKKIRAGVGKLRGRKYQRKLGPLIVVSKTCDLEKAARNIPGIRVIEVSKLSAGILAPGAKPARLTIFTEPAIDRMAKEALFI